MSKVNKTGRYSFRQLFDVEGVHFANTFYRETGIFLDRQEVVTKSLKFFDNALNVSSNDFRALMGRYRARAKKCMYKGALEDINAMLKLKPNDIYVLGANALATYLGCKFEEALVQNTRLCSRRRMPDNFIMGVMHCSDAIGNTVGQRAGHPLRDHYTLVRKLAWRRALERRNTAPRSRYRKRKRRDAAPRIACPKNRIRAKAQRVAWTDRADHGWQALMQFSDLFSEATPESSITESLGPDNDCTTSCHRNSLKNYPFKPKQRYTSNIDNYMAEVYLNRMRHDKCFLGELPSKDGVQGLNKDREGEIVRLARGARKYIDHNQELLRARRPFYFIKNQVVSPRGKLLERQLECFVYQRHETIADAEEMVRHVAAASRAGEVAEMTTWANRFRDFCDKTSNALLPSREKLLDEMYELVRDGFYRCFRFSFGTSIDEKLVKMRETLGLPTGRFCWSNMNYAQLCSTFEKRVIKSKSLDEVQWLYHELARYYLEQKNYSFAKVYAHKCISFADTAMDGQWKVNALFVLVKIHLRMSNKLDALIQLKIIQTFTDEIKDNDTSRYVRDCIKMVKAENMDSLGGTKLIVKRQKKIVHLMLNEKMKADTDNFFRMISLMPSNRKMSVVPGVIYDKEPTRKQSVSSNPSTKKKAFFKEALVKSRGRTFLRLVDDHVIE